MKIPKEVVIVGTTRELLIKPKKQKGRGLSDTLKKMEFRKDAHYTPWFFAVSKDHKTLWGWRYTMKKRENKRFIVDKGRTRGAFHRLEEYYIKSDTVKDGGEVLEIYYSSPLFDDPGHAGRPDEYNHIFWERPRVYFDNLANPSMFAIEYKPKRAIFAPDVTEQYTSGFKETTAGIID